MRSPCILVVEDDEATRTLFPEILLAFGMSAVLACTGDEAIERAQAIVPAAILLDLLLPGMPCPDVVKTLKSDPRTRAIPIIAVTTGLAGSEEAARTAGCDDYIRKPFDLSRLEDALRVFVGPPPRVTSGT
jgi:two-component system cell cycle response regulator DivK